MKNYNEYLEKLVNLQQISDTEFAHMQADDILVEILIDLGFKNIVDEYEKVHKWYA